MNIPPALVAPLAAAAISALIGGFVYYYRSLVTFHSIELCGNFKVNGRHISISDEWNAAEICSVYLEIANSGFKNVDNFEFSFRALGDFLRGSVIKTSSISDKKITMEKQGDIFSIEMPSLPRGEVIEFHLVFSTPPWIHDARGGDGKYKLQPIYYYLGFRKAVDFFKNLVIVGLLILIVTSIRNT